MWRNKGQYDTKKCINSHLKERSHLEDLAVDRRLIKKWVSEV
jgi:hypothetical protein